MSDEVRSMFSGIAGRYDRANTILSFGVHHGWRRKTVRAARLERGKDILDVATGTGDLAFAFARAAGPTGHVTGVDFARPMLMVAQDKVPKRTGPHDARVTFAAGDALRLPFRDESFDVASIAFGIRNVDDPVAGLREMRRVLRPGGRLLVLEFGQPKGPVGVPYRWYSKHIMPRLGALITGQREPYEYLPKTAATFPAGELFLELMREAGGTEPKARSLTGGIAWLYSDVK